jgi:CelD/BcsL family acetyltransferase involved in cellulose biosynthesis
MLRIAIHRSALALEAIRSAWERLYRESHGSVFQSPAWNLLAARVFAGSDEPLVIDAENDSGAAIIPACISSNHVSLLGEALFDYRDVLVAGDQDVLCRAWQQVAMTNRPLSVTALHGERPRRRWEKLGFTTAPFCNAPAVRRADISADDFAKTHTRSARLLRRLARAGVEVQTRGGGESALVREIYEAKARQLAATPGNLFADRRRIDFMAAIAAAEPGCEIFTLEAAGALVAALVTFRDELHSVRRFYTVYYDHAWAHQSPGVALLFEVTRRSLEQGLDCDYLTGEQPHKTRFATHLAPLFRVEAKAAELARISRPAPALQLAA